MKHAYLTLLLCLCVTTTASAQRTDNLQENYYFRVGTGYPFVTYSDDLQSAIDLVELLGARRTLIATLDVGVYWPLASRRTLLGVSMTGIPDFYTDDNWEGTVNFMQIGPALQYFLTSKIGKGLFLRLEPGLVLQWTDVTIREGSTTIRTESEQKSGFGVLAGGGYAIPLSPGTRLTIDAHASFRSADPNEAVAVHIGAGLLW